MAIKPKRKPKAFLGQQVKVNIPNVGEVVGEVTEISKDIKNLITKVKVAIGDGFKEYNVEDLIVEAVLIVKKIRLSQAFKLLFTAIGNLFRKKKKEV